MSTVFPQWLRAQQRSVSKVASTSLGRTSIFRQPGSGGEDLGRVSICCPSRLIRYSIMRPLFSRGNRVAQKFCILLLTLPTKGFASALGFLPTIWRNLSEAFLSSTHSQSTTRSATRTPGWNTSKRKYSSSTKSIKHSSPNSQSAGQGSRNMNVNPETTN